jgi:hypothetical protein
MSVYTAESDSRSNDALKLLATWAATLDDVDSKPTSIDNI